MNIAIVGAGYVGLPTGLALAYLGNDIVFIDVDSEKIELLKKGKIPFYEPYLNEMLNLTKDNVKFTTDYKSGLKNISIVFICVGTPADENGKPNLTNIKAVAEMIGEYRTKKLEYVVNKSTVPIGFGKMLHNLINKDHTSKHIKGKNYITVVSNPEFLREGSALYDTFYPDRIVVGSDEINGIEAVSQLYSPIVNQNFTPPSFLQRPNGLSAVPIVTTDLCSAELIKYAANAFLAMKISFINEIANLCEKVGGDINEVAKGIGLDSRIGRKFLNAGIGWGGSCFGKDTSALIEMAKEYGLKLHMIEAARIVNYNQRTIIIEKLKTQIGNLANKSIGILGLSFKPNTDDLRDAPAIDIINKLLSEGAYVKVHDPVSLQKFLSMTNKSNIYGNTDVYKVIEGCDAVFVLTEWDIYKELDWQMVKRLMRGNVVIDGRNALNRELLIKSGFIYIGVGR
ncbi:nucleotide sugar dehydrogenase [Caldicellulosiruptor acetigenus I77R1B]|jgi:UDPglucose 6-dehydrogenase|uniref:UDP-glucose 6-dehydrogenase n=1 Tax=Caldicellulosiruptor acetigenus (strain ATCC 700853 / DSM 12137 / I77R1B) TaxID=632335 RepID=E4S7Y1_CALA7|nr:UDP-glucose/GDP-mannose dehydrogenase family protein [Caldicellulosiruptor acetigenus]ADQ41881.1 nucleotide sugar dehydrogenase [Caldicellulosiruptor acetigenus I77R1B]